MPARALAGSVAILTALVASLSASAAFPGTNGDIVFQANRDGNEEIYSMNADGTDRVNLTRHASTDIDPHWSADGNRIVFVSNRDGNHEIYRMNDDGSAVTQLTVTSGVVNRWPSWTNDGRVLFHSGPFPNRDVYVVNPDGSGLTNLTPGQLDNAWAAASPRGPMIAFSRFSEAEGQRLYTLNLLSGVTKRVSPPSLTSADVQASWSPSGNDLVYQSIGASGSELFKAHKDGTGLVQLTSTPSRAESSPSFSPDGTKVLFGACTDPGTAAQRCGNYTMNADGTGEVEVTLLPRAPYTDTFTDTWVDPFWSIGTTGTGPSVAQAQGQLEVTLPAGTTFGSSGFANAFAFMSCRFPGDFDMHVDYRLLSTPLPAQVNVGFDAAEFTGGSYSGQHGVFVHNAGGTTQGVSTHFPGSNVFLPDSSASGSLRLERRTVAGTTRLTAYRLVGASWSAMLTSEPYSVDASAANLNVFTNLLPFPADVRVAYDNFKITSGDVHCPGWWADRNPDWQPIGQ